MLSSPDAPFDISFYEPQLRILQSDPNTRIVGSIGRMVASKQIVETPFTEFYDRDLAGLDVTRTSDIDVLGTSFRVMSEARYAGDARIDSRVFFNSDVAVVCEEDGDWYLRSFDADFEERLNPQVMEAVSDEVQGVEIVTVPIQTHLALHTLRLRNAKKDSLTEKTIRYLSHNKNLIDGVEARIDERYFLPFAILRMKLRLQQRALMQRYSGEERYSS